MRGLWLSRFMLAITAFVALWYLLSPSARLEGPERLEQVLAGAGLLVWSIGLLLPWGRWIRLVSPGPNLGLFTQMIGWAGACGLPVAIVDGQPLMTLVCALVPVAAFGMWRQRAWAVWAWSAVVACGLVLHLVSFVRIASGADPEVQGTFAIAFELVRVVCFALCMVAFMSTVRNWGRSLGSSGAAARAPSAS